MEDNTLALVELVQSKARESLDTWRIDSDLVALGTRLGIPMEDMQDALASDRMLVIYEP